MLTQITRAFVAFTAALVLGSVGYGYAASNDARESAGGEAASGISGYVVANVSYGLNSSDPTLVDAVSFDMSGEDTGDTPARARVRLTSTSDAWYSCWPDTAVSSTRFRCPTLAPHATVAGIDELRVVAAR